jgi:hypothetical protein
VSDPGRRKSRDERVRYWIRCGARLGTVWARECRGTRVGTGTAREPMNLEGPAVRFAEDGFLEVRHLCKRQIVCSYETSADMGCMCV